MKNYYLNIILPSIICLIVIVAIKPSIEYYPLSFGLIIGLINFTKYRQTPYLGLLLCLVASYGAFFLGYFSFPLIAGLIKPLLGVDNSGVIGLMVSTSIISPLLLVFLYNFVFRYNKIKFTKLIVICSVALLIVVFLTNNFFKELIKLNFDFNQPLDHYALWQLIMATTIQLLIHKKEIKG